MGARRTQNRPFLAPVEVPWTKTGQNLNGEGRSGYATSWNRKSKWKSRLTVRDYLQKAGGPTEGADEDHIFVIAANGSVLTDEGVRNSNRNVLFPLLPVIHGGLMDTRLGPGDTVYVPEQLVYISGLQYATDITQIIANSAMSLAVIGILGTGI